MSGYAFHPDAFADLDEIGNTSRNPTSMPPTGFSPTSIQPHVHEEADMVETKVSILRAPGDVVPDKHRSFRLRQCEHCSRS
jgi:hypothetical protein